MTATGQDSYRIPSCKICGSEAFRAFSRTSEDGLIVEAKLHDQGYVREYYRCDDCGLVFHTGFDQLKGGQYALVPSKDGGVSDGVDRMANRALREAAIAGELFALHGLDPKRVKLMVHGCGMGMSFNLFLRHGIDAYGHDIKLTIRRDPPFPPELFDRSLVPEMLRRFLDSDSLGKQRFDVITMTEVFEHLTHPLEEMEALVRLLKPGGILFGTTGMADGVRGDLKQWWYVRCMFHALFLTRRAFQVLCAKLGVLGEIYPPTPRLIGNTDMSAEQGVFVMHKP